MSKKVKLGIDSWDYSCPDGCCYDYGENIVINGTVIEADIRNDPCESIEGVLKFLGYEVEWEEDEERLDG
ncbi:hypothetical protein ACU3L3_07325 [Priestia endophytica]